MKVPMTPEGAESLRNEMAHLKSVVRPQIAASIAEARAHGDLKENAEYHAAKEQQGFSEGRVMEIEGKLANAQIIDVKKLQNGVKVVFGCTVTLLNIDTDESTTYKIVGEDEADIKISKISVLSPLARAIIGKSAEDEVRFEAPSGVIEYEVLSVEYV
ncbi:MAG: transcription elongation factor GreA [Pseudomonadales bacterium]|nr:transcription elongation factor GreA [Pseudomonadales bacterium]